MNADVSASFQGVKWGLEQSVQEPNTCLQLGTTLGQHLNRLEVTKSEEFLFVSIEFKRNKYQLRREGEVWKGMT